jgi:hypothetical protein
MPNEPESFLFADDGETPNNPRLPLLVYRRAVDPSEARDPAVPFERAFARHGWGDGWRNGIFGFLHFHPGGHEVLGIARGRARVEFGGARGQVFEVAARSTAAPISWSSAPIPREATRLTRSPVWPATPLRSPLSRVRPCRPRIRCMAAMGRCAGSGTPETLISRHVQATFAGVGGHRDDA